MLPHLPQLANTAANALPQGSLPPLPQHYAAPEGGERKLQLGEERDWPKSTQLGRQPSPCRTLLWVTVEQMPNSESLEISEQPSGGR